MNWPAIKLANIRQKIVCYVWSYHADDSQVRKSSWRHFLQILAMVSRDLYSGMLSLRSTSLVYTTLLSIVPVLAISLAISKAVGLHDQLEPTLIRILAPLGEQSQVVSALMISFLQDMEYGLLGILGTVLLVYNVFSLILKVESAFNDTWRVRANRPVLLRLVYYLVIMLVGPVLIFSTVGITASLGSNTFLNGLEALPYIGRVVSIAGRSLPYILVTFAFCFIYLLVPNVRVKFRSAFFGALTAGILWASLSLLFASFAGSTTHYTAIYSSFAIMLIFMIWLYLSWLVLLIGASIAYHHQHPQQIRPRDNNLHLNISQHEKLALNTMVDIGRASENQSKLVPTLGNLAADQQVPGILLEPILAGLEADGLIICTDDEPPLYLPAVSCDRIPLVQILRGTSARSEAINDPTAKMLHNVNYAYEQVLGEQTLAEFLKQYAPESME